MPRIPIELVCLPSGQTYDESGRRTRFFHLLHQGSNSYCSSHPRSSIYWSNHHGTWYVAIDLDTAFLPKPSWGRPSKAVFLFTWKDQQYIFTAVFIYVWIYLCIYFWLPCLRGCLQDFSSWAAGATLRCRAQGFTAVASLLEHRRMGF